MATVPPPHDHRCCVLGRRSALHRRKSAHVDAQAARLRAGRSDKQHQAAAGGSTSSAAAGDDIEKGGAADKKAQPPPLPPVNPVSSGPSVAIVDASCGGGAGAEG